LRCNGLSPNGRHTTTNDAVAAFGGMADINNRQKIDRPADVTRMRREFRWVLPARSLMFRQVKLLAKANESFVCQSTFPGAESTQEIDDQTNQQNQAQPAAADHRTAKVKATAAEQEHEHHHE
jgi:hypothetical protein